MNKEAANFEAISLAVKDHNSRCKEKPTGIGMSYFDIDRMGWEEGDIILGLPLVNDGGGTGNIRIICAEGHGGSPAVEAEKVEKEIVFAREQELVPVGA